MGDPRSSDLPAALILAAGASTRMGRVKAGIVWRGRTFLAHTLSLAADCAPVVIVSGAHSLHEFAPVGSNIIENPCWEQGPLSSLQRGLGALPSRTPVLVLTVDRPHVRPDTVSALLRAHRSHPDSVAQPAHNGTRGHPLVLPADLVAEVLSLEPTQSLRDLLRRADIRPRRKQIAVNDPGVLDNLDRPADLVRLPDP
jgi:molybdenum cofactor cytidylyltransferase